MPRHDPSHPLTVVEKLVFGEDAKRHQILGFVLENGYGAGNPDLQAENYCRTIDAEEGRAAGNLLRRKCKLPVTEDIAAATVKAEQLRTLKDQTAYAALADKPVLEARIAELEADIPGASDAS